MNWGTSRQKAMKLRFMLEQYAFMKNPGLHVPFLPDQVDLDISNQCNLKCITCFQSAEGFKPKKNMTMETFRAVLDQAEGNASSITFGNHGEPFMHKQVLDMIAEVKERGFFFNMIDNGTLLTPERAQALIDLKVDRLSFSLDSVDPDIYPQLRRGAWLKRTLLNILHFLKLNLEQGLPVYVNVSTVNSDLCLQSSPDIRDFFAELPIHVLYTSDILNFQDCLEIRNQTKLVRMGYDKITDREQLPSCMNGFDRILVRPNGDVSMCPVDWNCVHIIGNVNDTPYTELWNNDKAREFRHAQLTRDYSAIEGEKPLCSQCDGKWVLDHASRPEMILNTLSADLCDSKPTLDAKISTDAHRRALGEAIAWAESLPDKA